MVTGIVPAQVLLSATAPLRNICAVCGRRPVETVPTPRFGRQSHAVSGRAMARINICISFV